METQVDLVQKSVGFADLVDSTAWTQQLDFLALSRALSEFEAVASEVIVARRGRVVKNIGDEVMYVADDAATAADVALALIDVLGGHPVLPQLRAGIASGEVIARDGDYSGSIVNLAARALTAAAPSTLLVDRATRDALPGARFTCGDERAVALKGFDAPIPLYEVTRAG
jgi:adenylate cyclase